MKYGITKYPNGFKTDQVITKDGHTMFIEDVLSDLQILNKVLEQRTERLKELTEREKNHLLYLNEKGLMFEFAKVTVERQKANTEVRER